MFVVTDTPPTSSLAFGRRSQVNERVIGLYTKMGYCLEGTKTAALLVDNHAVDEFRMAKLLD